MKKIKIKNKNKIHQVITMLADARVIIKVKGHQHQWLADGYDLEIGLLRGG